MTTKQSPEEALPVAGWIIRGSHQGFLDGVHTTIHPDWLDQARKEGATVEEVTLRRPALDYVKSL